MSAVTLVDKTKPSSLCSVKSVRSMDELNGSRWRIRSRYVNCCRVDSGAAASRLARNARSSRSESCRLQEDIANKAARSKSRFVDRSMVKSFFLILKTFSCFASAISLTSPK